MIDLEYILAEVNVTKQQNQSPIKIHPEVLCKLLFAVNPALGAKEINYMLLQLYKYKNWKLN